MVPQTTRAPTRLTHRLSSYKFSDFKGRLPRIGEICQGQGARFVIWEIEMSETQIDRLAIDFDHGSAGPVMIRSNSSFK